MSLAYQGCPVVEIGLFDSTESRAARNPCGRGHRAVAAIAHRVVGEWAPQTAAITVATWAIVTWQGAQTLLDRGTVVCIDFNRPVVKLRGELIDARLDEPLQKVHT